MPETEREILALRYRPHPGQVAVHASAARFRFVCCGRRWGKTRLAADELLNRAGGEAAGDYGWIAPTYLIAERGIDACRLIAGKLLRFSGKNPTSATFDGAAGPVRVFFLSTDNPERAMFARLAAEGRHDEVRAKLDQAMSACRQMLEYREVLRLTRYREQAI